MEYASKQSISNFMINFPKRLYISVVVMAVLVATPVNGKGSNVPTTTGKIFMVLYRVVNLTILVLIVIYTEAKSPISS